MGINEFIKIGSRIKELRISKGISQKDMAERLKINRSTYSNYENDIREPNLEIIKKIAAELDVDISEFIGADRIYSNLTMNTDKYYTDSKYYPVYTLEKSQELINLYFNGVMHWVNDKLFSEEEKCILNEHFCEILIRYKNLLEAMLNSKLSYSSNEKNIQKTSEAINANLTPDQQKALYIGNNVDRQINDLSSYIQALPIMFSYATNKEGE